MNEIDKWREWFLQQFGEVRDAFLAHRKSSTHVTSLFLSTHFKPGFDPYSGGILIDIGLSKDGRKINVVGATFSKSSAALYVGRSLICFEISESGNTGTLTFSGEKNIFAESTEGFIKYQIDESMFRLIDLNASLQFWNHRESEYSTVAQWNIEDLKSSQFEVLCCACFGEGSSKQMSIPKAEYESGLSGYALYSCNTINGTYGCSACGGSGAKY